MRGANLSNDELQITIHKMDSEQPEEMYKQSQAIAEDIL